MRSEGHVSLGIDRPLAKFLRYSFYLLLRYILRYRRAVIIDNVEQSDIKVDDNTFLRDHYRFLADLITLSFLTHFIHPSTLSSKYHNTPHLDSVIEQNQGPTMLWTAHYNNWEWSGIALAHLSSRPVRLVYQRQSGPVQYLLNLMRRSSGATLISQDELLKSISEDQKSKTDSLYVMLCDQGPVFIEKAFWIRFLGRDTPFLSGPERIARKWDIPVYYAAIYGSQHRYYPEFKRIESSPSRGDMTVRFAELLEKTIRKDPSRWLWSHKRWKRAHRKDEVQDQSYLLFDK